MNSESSFFQNVRTALDQYKKRLGDKDPLHGSAGVPYKEENEAKEELLDTINNRSPKEQEQLLDLLEENCRELNIELYRTESLLDAKETIIEILRSKEPEFSHTKHVTLHNHPDLVAMQLWQKFSRESITVHTTFREDKEVREKTVASFVGITAPSMAVADSATLLEIPDPGRPRSTSLLPSIHIALIRRENIIATLSEAYAMLEKIQLPDSFVFISGPSKTADIEAQLVHGAHGPRELHLVVIAEPFPEEDQEETVVDKDPEQNTEAA